MARRASESPYSAANAEFATEFPAAPLDASSASKFAKEIKTLTETVQALAHKLKRRDREVRKLQDTAKNYAEVSLKLESTEERLVEATMDNKSMEKVVQGLKSSIGELTEDAKNNPSLSGVTETKKPEKKMIEVEEHKKVRMQVSKVGVYRASFQSSISPRRFSPSLCLTHT
jgi:DNA repair exonuclease SbcCD ATPase subunit